jgi:hypothetical protein
MNKHPHPTDDLWKDHPNTIRYVSPVRRLGWHRDAWIDDRTEWRQDLLKDGKVERQTAEGSYETVKFDKPEVYWI